MKWKEFLFGKNDWQIVWEDEAEFEVNYFLAGSGWTVAACYYKIYYSPSRNKYKLETSGFQEAKKHSKYQEALAKLKQLKS